MSGATERGELPPPQIQEVSDGVFAYLQPDGSWGLNNPGFLVGSEAVVVIDTCFTERRSRTFYDAIRGVTDRPLRTLINTHHHGDHTHGNYVFLPAATIIGHELCRAEIIETGLATKGMFPGVDWGEIRIAPPFVTFEERLNVYVDDLKVELAHVGPAHTTNDIVAWLPERKVLFTGDVVFHQGTPFAMMGSVAGWLEALDALRGLGAETVVPGHGPVCGPDVFDEIEDYLRFVQETAAKGLADGLTPLETAQRTDLGRFSGLLDPERLVGNLHRAYSELRGEPRGTPLAAAVVPDIVAYNGGRLPRCLA
jgi:cyclase